jgi:hypothetical protein
MHMLHQQPPESLLLLLLLRGLPLRLLLQPLLQMLHRYHE